MDCPEFHEYDCLYPCVGFATRVGCPESPGRCQCQIPIEAKTVPLGGRCQHAGNCAPPGKYCYGECNQAPTCHETESVRPTATLAKVCEFAGADKQKECETCMSNGIAVWTAIGCIPATIDGFVKKILPFAMGIGGGIAFLLMLFGALQIMTSAGNPEKLNAGKELVTSAIVGLLLIIFSIFLLRLIGADILGVPGFK